MPSSTPPLTVRLPEKTRADVDRFAELTKRSRSFIIKEAVEQYLQDRSAYLAELDAAVASIDAAETYDAETVFDWMKTWGTADEKPLAEGALAPRRRSV